MYVCVHDVYVCMYVCEYARIQVCMHVRVFMQACAYLLVTPVYGFPQGCFLGLMKSNWTGEGEHNEMRCGIREWPSLTLQHKRMAIFDTESEQSQIVWCSLRG